jgi:hypothetical protein
MTETNYTHIPIGKQFLMLDLWPRDSFLSLDDTEELTELSAEVWVGMEWKKA